jgi:hypothetical protein
LPRDLEVGRHGACAIGRRSHDLLGDQPVGGQIRHRDETGDVDRPPQAFDVDDVQPAPPRGRLGRGPVERLAVSVAGDRHDDRTGVHLARPDRSLHSGFHDPPPKGGRPAPPRTGRLMEIS